MYFTLYSRIAY